MRNDLLEIRYKLKEIAETEATRLYRMARNLQERGGNPETIRKIRMEANELHMTGYPERLIDPFKNWQFAFKI